MAGFNVGKFNVGGFGGSTTPVDPGFGNGNFGTDPFGGGLPLPALEIYDFTVSSGSTPQLQIMEFSVTGTAVVPSQPQLQITEFSVTGTPKATGVAWYRWDGTNFIPVDMYSWDGTKAVAPANLYYAPLS